jgi:hypothetical protein
MKKFAILAGLVAVALLLGMAGTAIRTDKAQAKPEEVLAFSPNVCISLMRVIEADCNGSGTYTAGECDAACAATAGTADGLNDLARGLGADVSATVGADPESKAGVDGCGDGVDNDADTTVDDGCATGYNDPALWQDLNDLSGAQLGDYSVPAATQGKLWVLTFVTNDGALTLEADEGIWASNGASNTNCGAIADEDCNGDGTKGDKVVVDLLYGNDVADLGDAELVATQAGVDVIYDYMVVGEPEDITLALFPDGNVQEGIEAADCADDPHLTPLDSSVFTDGAAEPEKNGLLATVTDDDGTELAGIYVDWSSDDTDVANLNLDKSISWALESGTVAANLFCGNETGTATITADIGVEDAEVDVTVIGAPDAMTLTASPASITCDGVNSSTVSATLVDSDGNKVVDGTKVRFEVVALGIADPITAKTAGGAGAAESKITPLSGVSAGVVVLVTALDADGDVALEGNIRIDCALPVAPPPPPVSPTGPTVVPPGTGDGGYLP